jgi:hypothetical protein
MKPRKAVIIGAGCGLLVGILMVAPLKCNFGWTNVGEMIWGFCNGPAMLLSYGFTRLWFSMGLGPHGDAGFGAIAVSIGVAIVIQWVLVGMIVGLLIAHRYFKLAKAIGAVVCVAVLGMVLCALLSKI